VLNGTPVSTASLARPATWSEALTYRNARRSTFELAAPALASPVRAAVFAAVLTGGLTLLLAGVAAAVSPAAPVAAAATTAMISLGVAALISAATAVTALVWVRPWKTRAQLDRFASANAMTYLPETDPVPPFIGSVFTFGSLPPTAQLLHLTPPGRYAAYGHVWTFTGHKRSPWREWSVLAVHLHRVSPHLLVAHPTRTELTNRPEMQHLRDHVMPAGPSGGTRWRTLSTDRHNPALSELATDLMATMDEYLPDWDVEVVHDWLFAYRPGQVDLRDPDLHVQVFAGMRALAETADRHLPEPVTAEPDTVEPRDEDGTASPAEGALADRKSALADPPV
jgi:hypothetical protein